MTDAYTTSVRIEATPAEIFPYFTDPELFVRWMGDWAKLDPTAGGVFAVDINGAPIRGEYLVVEPPHRLVFTWGAAGSTVLPAGSTTVEITLRPVGEGEAQETVLELVHRDLPEEELPKHEEGWAHYLPRIVVAASGGDPGPDPWSEP
jgi:uncharacterized protein YndB with AHSA1/START domain